MSCTSSRRSSAASTISSGCGAAPSASKSRPDIVAGAPARAEGRLRSAIDGIAAVIIAPECAACASPLDVPLAGPVCEACWTAILPFTPPLCDGCGDPLPSGRSAACPSCRRPGRHVDRARAIGAYDARLRDIIHAFKYEKRRSLARPLGALMRRHGADLIEGADAAVPVPLHWTRRFQRGFNQAELLARGLGLPVRLALRRRRHTRPQVELPAGARHRNVADAFGLAWPYRRNGARHLFVGSVVVLVDDVSTTGATLEACAEALKRAGVKEVRALTAARVVTPRR